MLDDQQCDGANEERKRDELRRREGPAEDESPIGIAPKVFKQEPGDRVEEGISQNDLTLELLAL
jgi:hypothetical protein